MAWEKAIPAVTSAMAPIAVAQAISSREAQAAMATTAAPRQASRSRTESSGIPGWLALRTTSTRLTARATARARRRPALRRSATAATTGPAGSRVPSRTGAPPSNSPTTVPSASSATRSAASGSAGSSTVIVTALAAGRSSSRTITFPAWAVDRQWTRRRLSPGHVRAGAPGQAHVGPGAIEDVARSVVGVEARGLGPAAARGDVQWRRQAERHPARPPLQRERRGRRDIERHRMVDAPPDGDEGDHVDRGAPASPRSDEHLGTGWLHRADAHPGAGVDPQLHREARHCRRPARCAR